MNIFLILLFIQLLFITNTNPGVVYCMVEMCQGEKN